MSNSTGGNKEYQNSGKRTKKPKLLSIILGIILLVIGAYRGVMPQLPEEFQVDLGPLLSETSHTSSTSNTSNPKLNLDDIPKYSGKPYVVINQNKPYFTQEEITKESFEYYSPLDSLGRCQMVIASIGTDIMPTEKRENISHVKPTGWHSVQYDFISTGSLYNRCHLIGHQLTGENANPNNLITGTRYLNVDGMLPYEELVAEYVIDTGNQVMYRVTPIFEGNNLVASGVLMEGLSVEDGGKGVQFCVYCYNVQPGVKINYSNGDNEEA